MGKKRQLRLFKEPESGGAWLEEPPLNPRPHLKAEIAQTMDGSRWSRPQIAERMNYAFKMAGMPNRVTLARLDAWAARSKTALPDLLEAEFFYWAAEGRLPLAGQAQRASACLVSREEEKFLKLGRAEHELRRLNQETRRLRQEIEGKPNG